MLGLELREVVLPPAWVLGTEDGFSTRAVRAPNR